MHSAIDLADSGDKYNWRVGVNAIPPLPHPECVFINLRWEPDKHEGGRYPEQCKPMVGHGRIAEWLTFRTPWPSHSPATFRRPPANAIRRLWSGPACGPWSLHTLPVWLLPALYQC
jgi:hypothetical protein